MSCVKYVNVILAAYSITGQNANHVNDYDNSRRICYKNQLWLSGWNFPSN